MQELPVSPLAPAEAASPTALPVPGLALYVAELGLKYKARPDVFLAVMEPGSHIAGIFTQSSTASAAVRWGRTAIQNGFARAILVNAGNSIAFTGKAGEDFVQALTTDLGEKLDCRAEDILTASTGVIGEPACPTPIIAALDTMLAGPQASWGEAANAIRTTDTFAKTASATTRIHGTPITLSGIAKGSGMVEPNMATMLGFIFTDAKIAPDVLQRLLVQAGNLSFNAITVDSDSSTSDTVLLAATGKADHIDITDLNDPALDGFKQALHTVCINLAQQIVRDGEGATKFIEIRVQGAADDRAAKIVAKSIANSPLVKTAIAGEDANWGRIVMAVGKSGEHAPEHLLSIAVGGIALAHRGERVADFDEAPVTAHMQGSEILIEVDLGTGSGAATIWTCDLTQDYISINADYRS